MRRLDTIWDSLQVGSQILLKLDVQGAERLVLRGASEALHHIGMLRLELSTLPLYDGQDLAAEMIEHLASEGFLLAAIDSAWGDPATGRTVQFDAVFTRQIGSTVSIGHI